MDVLLSWPSGGHTDQAVVVKLKADKPNSSTLASLARFLESLRYSSILSLLSFAATSLLSLACRSSNDSFGGGCSAKVSGSSDPDAEIGSSDIS